MTNSFEAESNEIPLNIANLMRAFEANGYEILIVGGAIRDSILKRPL